MSAQATAVDQTDTVTRNKAIVLDIHDRLDQDDFAVLDGHPALAWMREWFPRFKTAFPDARATSEELIGEGDWVAFRLTVRGTHVGTWYGHTPTGKELEWEVIGTYRFDADGRIVAAHGQANTGEAMLRAGSEIVGEEVPATA